MNHRILALAGLALTVPATVQAAATPVAPEASQGETERSEAATRVVNWVASAKDNAALPYVVIDKPSATLYLFDAKGRQVATSPVLLGIALGDDATPGIGSKNLSEIGPAEKTTPAGRFLAKFGVAAGKQRVLWVDYATSVALHPIPPVTKANKKDHRKDRMLSPTIDDNRITYGCINVTKVTYAKVSKLFGKKGGYVYILPDLKPVEDAFPPLYAQPYLTR
ncbi:hypothetical protein GGQ88_002032 [Novosphingobium hassiacum]|uniref:L,D-transpeptidase n=1 Tax=Novosphingobium hassiacum TaxID=173676 RepID=A0A7W6EVX9_9SPHN|nr:hypothetical protein [Novosphingobium hassiacum]MBB3860763.1 hypothetical protein [Novosphingobium hassiacum]